MTAALLKLHRGRGLNHAVVAIRRLMTAALLKLDLASFFLNSAHAPIRRLMTAALLKRCRAMLRSPFPGNYPPSDDGGPIEATTVTRTTSRALRRYPPSDDGGPIEANVRPHPQR